MRRARMWGLAGLLALGACGGGDGGDGGGDGGGTAEDTTGTPGDPALPEGCEQPPLTMHLEAGGTAPAGGAQIEVLDAVARRVPILPGLPTTGDPAEMSDREELAESTDLALYSVYIGDYDIDHTPLEEFGFGDLRPPAGQTLGVLTIVPPTQAGFAAGDVADGSPPGYDATTTFAPLGLTVTEGAPGEDPASSVGQGYTDIEGQVEILALDDDWICVDVDVRFLNSATVVYAAEGVVAAPIVRPPTSFYFT